MIGASCSGVAMLGKMESFLGTHSDLICGKGSDCDELCLLCQFLGQLLLSAEKQSCCAVPRKIVQIRQTTGPSLISTRTTIYDTSMLFIRATFSYLSTKLEELLLSFKSKLLVFRSTIIIYS